MSEVNRKYVVNSEVNVSEFKSKSCCLDLSDPSFTIPSPLEIKTLRNIIGFSQTDLAQFVGVSWNHKGSNTVRKWETNSATESRVISLSAWKLMLVKAGFVKIDVLDI
tara:strand:- start:289 stop:612 length:324 start_codon:yes stop_codon:yes gene_type:complete